MPKIERQFILEITPERFLNACSPYELAELEMLLSAPMYQEKIPREDAEQLLRKNFLPL